jgi:hypothetical protein
MEEEFKDGDEVYVEDAEVVAVEATFRIKDEDVK